LAGPGGKIAKELFETPIGKLFAILLFVVFSPFIIVSWYRKHKSTKAIKNKLIQLSNSDFEIFDEINLKNRITDIFTRVHNAWSERDLDDCDDFMTNWYRQNQQTVFLDQWDRKGLMNVCTIQKINSIKPIHIRVTQNHNFEGSRIIYAIEAIMEDYLISIEDSSVIEGKKGFKEVETVWTLKLVERVWKVDNIEQSEMIPEYTKMESKLSTSIVKN